VLVDRRRRALGSVYVARDVTEANALRRRLVAAHSQLVRQVETIDLLRADLVVARWGGEESFIALPGADAAAEFTFADDLRRRCEQDSTLVAGWTIRCLDGALSPEGGAAVGEQPRSTPPARRGQPNKNRCRGRKYRGQRTSSGPRARRSWAGAYPSRNWIPNPPRG